MIVTWQNQVANAYAAKIAKLEQAARDNPNFAKKYLNTAKILQKTVDLYRNMASDETLLAR
jgi:hypothetical protein